MCLKINSDSFTEDTFKVAKEDISCYKVYCKRPQKEYWETPIFSVPAPQLGELRQSREKFNISGIFVDENMETMSGIHTFVELEGVAMMIYILSYRVKICRNSVRIVRSIIPKETKYLEGEDILGKTYSSEYLIDKEVISQIDPEEIRDSLAELIDFVKKIK